MTNGFHDRGLSPLIRNRKNMYVQTDNIGDFNYEAEQCIVYLLIK